MIVMIIEDGTHDFFKGENKKWKNCAWPSPSSVNCVSGHHFILDFYFPQRCKLLAFSLEFSGTK